MKFQEAVSKPTLTNKWFVYGAEVYFQEFFVKLVLSLNKEATVIRVSSGESVHSYSESSFFGKTLYLIKDLPKEDSKRVAQEIALNTQDVFLFTFSKIASLTAYSDLVGVCEKVECTTLKVYGKDYPAWISTKFSSLGFKMEVGVDILLLSLVGPSLFALHSELTKLILLAYESKTITRELVYQSFGVDNTRHYTVFDVSDAILEGSLQKALTTSKQYLAGSGEFPELVNILWSVIEKSYKVYLMTQRKSTVEEIFEKTGLHPFLLKTKYLPLHKKQGEKFFEKLLSNLLELEYNSRSSYLCSKEILLNSFLIKSLSK